MDAKLQPGKMNLTLVAYYGEKPPALMDFIQATQDHLYDCLGDTLDQYDMAQVHATVIGLEGTRIGNHIINTNYVERRQQLKAMSLPKLLTLLQGNPLPFVVRIGGYKDGEHFPFTSRGLHPYLRSFSVQGDIAVAMGWPFDGRQFPDSIERLRRKLNEANVLHRYHAKLDDEDNDFYFVLGRVRKDKITEAILQSTQERMREFLAQQPPLNLKISRAYLRIVAYVDTRLPLDTSHAYNLDEAENNLDEILSLYQELAA